MIRAGRNLTAACLCALALAGCKPQPAVMSPAALPSAATTPQAARAAYSGRTVVTYDANFGTQIEYHAPNGRSYLWFPGNSRPVPADWKVQFSETGNPLICWRYPNTSRNAVTGERGGRFRCTPFAYSAANTTAKLEGDPFGLESMKIPFRIPDKRAYSAAQLMKIAKRDPAALRYVSK